MKIVEIYTDGACRGNPGPGGWGAVLRYGTSEKRLSGAVSNTTNNQMELTAAIEALKALRCPCEVHLTTDSRYVQNGITLWLKNWKQNNWHTSNKKLVKNKELWEELDRLTKTHKIKWFWVKGHSGHPENELADNLANLAIDELIK